MNENIRHTEDGWEVEQKVLVKTVVWKSTDDKYYWGLKVGNQIMAVRLATVQEIMKLKSGMI